MAAQPARGAENPSAEALYRAGNSVAAIEAGEAEGDAQGLFVAAQAAIADAELRDAPCASCLQRLEDIARRAVDAAPDEVEGYVYLSVAIGLKAHLVGMFAARKEKLAERSDEVSARALRLAPESSLALAARGGWHIEVARLAGHFLARVLYGARADEGKVHFREAIAAEPENLVVKYQFALSLSGYDFDDEREEIEMLLAQAIETTPRDAYETAVQQRAEEFATLLAEDHGHTYRERVDAFQGYP